MSPRWIGSLAPGRRRIDPVRKGLRSARKFVHGRRKDYLALIREFPLREIRSEKENDAAIAVATTLMLREEKSLSPGETDYLGALSILIRDWEKNACPSTADQGPPNERLRHLMENSGMTQADLASLLGVRQPAVSLLLSGKRRSTADHASKLALRFKLSPGYFL
jgi:HTH-type transcriptional regulator/antitoxin HigA